MFLFGIRDENTLKILINELSKDWGTNGLSSIEKYLTKPSVKVEEIMDMDEIPKKWREICYKNYDIIIWLDHYFEMVGEENYMDIIPALLLYKYIMEDHKDKIPYITGKESTDEFMGLGLNISTNPTKYPLCVIYDEC